MSNVPIPPLPPATYQAANYTRPIARRRSRERGLFVYATFGLSLLWSLSPLALIALYGPDQATALMHWLSTGALPLGKSIGLPLTLFVYARFCLPAMFAILLAEIAHSLSGKFPD